MLLIVGLAPPAAAASRFVGVMSDGRQIEGNQIYDWYNDQSNPRLDDQRLLEPNNPVMWLRDREAMASAGAASYVETVNGDRLPGLVREFRQGNERANMAHPPHVVVEPSFEQRPAREGSDLSVRVATEYVRRIVWRQRGRDHYEPGQIFLRDGSSLAFRAVRLASSSVTLLTDAGPRRFSFGEVAELHFPQRDVWEAHWNELAVIGSDDKSRLMQIETGDGLVATSSLSRMIVLGHGGPDRYDYWIHAVQPAWSLDPLWVPCGNITIRRFFSLNEAPLFRLSATETTHAAGFGAEHQIGINQNALGNLLRSGDYEAGWGFGVRGAGQIRLPLDAAVRQLRGRIGLDQAAGGGGCIRARVFIGRDNNSHAWESSHLVGSRQSVSLGSVGIDPAADNGAAAELRLAIDAAHQGRPSGSDPWEIRDIANWMDPLLVLDESRVREEMKRRLPGRIAALDGWRVAGDQNERLKAVNHFSAIHPPMGEYRPLLLWNEEQPLRLIGTVGLSQGANWLIVLAAHRTHTGEPARIDVRIGGELAGTFQAPLLDPSHRDPAPLIVPLADFRRQGARQLDVEIVCHRSETPLDWRAISVVEQMPLLATLFEESGEFQPLAPDAPAGGAELTKADRHAGQGSVKVLGERIVRLRLPQPLEVRSNPEWGQYRYIRFAVRKAGGGRIGLELERPPGEERPARFDAGQGEPVAGEAKRVWSQELPDKWIVMTRDLVSDFGEFNVESLVLHVPDGSHALFDHVYLARNDKDFALTPAAISPELANQQARRELAAEVLEKSLPAVVRLEMPDGRRGTGTLIDSQGHILTAGHLTVAPNQEIKVRLADGREVKAKSLGVDRENDLAIVKLEEDDSWPRVEIEDHEQVPSENMYVAAIEQPDAPAGQEPLTHLVAVRRLVDGVIWTDFDVAEWTAGGPLWDKEGRLVGVLTSRSRFGGFQYIHSRRARASLDRMKRSEVWGEWASGSGPMVGLIIRTLSDGCRVIEVLPDSPAAAAGLAVDDYIVQVDGQDVASLGEIYSLLKSKNPGDKVRLQYVRGNQSPTAELTLTPRWP